MATSVGGTGILQPRDLEVSIPDDGLVVVAGLPGAGKSTLLRGVDGDAAVTILDSDQMRAAFAAALPLWVRYRWYRPLVHVAHRTRIFVSAARRTRPVIAHEPATRASTRALLIVIGVLTGRRRHLLWISSTPAEAERGQRARGRVINPRSFARHVRRAGKVHDILAAGRGLRGWHSVDVLPRPALGSRLVVRRVA